MSFFAPPPKPETPLGWHRILSPTASVKVSPIALGGISFGNEWSELFGKSEDTDSLLDTFYSLGGNFVDTSNTYNAESSEKLLGEWMEKRGTRDQMVIATKYGAGYRAYNKEKEPMQSNFTGCSAKNYIDILYVHWWDFATSVEEIMTHLHTLVMAKQVLYLGISDTPAWVVVKANEFARRNGLTPFCVYQGRWNAAFRDMESEIIPMCEDQGMAIVSWASFGGGQLTTAEQRERMKDDEDAPKGYGFGEKEVKVSEALEKIAARKNATFQEIALAYLFHQSTYVFPIVGVQTVEHVKAIPGALRIMLSKDDIDKIHDAAPFNPLFPNSFLFGEETRYTTKLTAEDVVQYKMAAWINAPPKAGIYEPKA